MENKEKWIRVEHGGNPLLSGLYIVQVNTEKDCPTVHHAYWTGFRWSNLRVCGEIVIAWMELPAPLTNDELNRDEDSIMETVNLISKIAF